MSFFLRAGTRMRVGIGGAAAMDGSEVADCKSMDNLLNRTDET
jgi:hypothetical protein